MEGHAYLVALNPLTMSVPAHSLTLEVSANTLRKVSVDNDREHQTDRHNASTETFAVHIWDQAVRVLSREAIYVKVPICLQLY